MKKAIRKGTKKPKITKDSKGKRVPLCCFIYSDRTQCVGSEGQSLPPRMLLGLEQKLQCTDSR